MSKGGNNSGGGGGQKSAPGLTVNHGISAVKQNGTPLQKAIGIGIDLLIATGAAFIAALAGEKVDAYFENRNKQAPKASPPDTSRQQFEHMLGMSIRDVEASGPGDTAKVRAKYLEHNPDHASWKELGNEISGILKLYAAGQWTAPGPDA